MATFGERLKELRKSKHLTQTELGNRVGISKSSIAMFESNQREPNFEILDHLADIFNVDIDYLMGRSNYTTRLVNLGEEKDYYINDETKKVAQEIFEDKELRMLFDTAKDSSPEDLRTAHEMLKALKRKEKGNYWDEK